MECGRIVAIEMAALRGNGSFLAHGAAASARVPAGAVTSAAIERMAMGYFAVKPTENSRNSQAGSQKIRKTRARMHDRDASIRSPLPRSVTRSLWKRRHSRSCAGFGNESFCQIPHLVVGCDLDPGGVIVSDPIELHGIPLRISRDECDRRVVPGEPDRIAVIG